MIRKLSLSLTLSLCMGLLSSLPADAVPLTQAVIRLLRNEVNLIPQGRSPRPASVSDTMTPGDALSTARQSFAEVQFNDGSLARVGESVLFSFVANTRTFRLNNGTVLMLIPPGQGGTRIRTPNATAGIRGSALFVRHNSDPNDPDGGTTLIGALTNSDIVVSNDDDSQTVTLDAGQMAVVGDGEILQVYEFDMETFYETSPLAVGLGDGEVNPSDSNVSPQVREEIRESLATASFPEDNGGNILVNPGFITSSDVSLESLLSTPVEPGGVDSPAETVDSIFTDGETILDIQNGNSVDPIEPIEPPMEPEPEPPIEPEPEPPIEPEPEPPMEPEPEPPIEPEPEPPIEPEPEPPIEPEPEPEPPIEPEPEPEPPIEPEPEPVGPGNPQDDPDLEVPPEDDAFGDDDDPFDDDQGNDE